MNKIESLHLFIQLSENDKRLIFALLLIFILVFVLIGFIGMWVSKIMKWQGKKMDTLVHDAVISKVITDKKHLRKYGRKKNWREFYKSARIPFLLILLSFLVLLINDIILQDFSYNIFDHKETGFPTLLFLWDFNDPEIYVKWFGLNIIADFPKLFNTPHFEVKAIGSYIFTPLFLVGTVWYLVAIQCFIARSYRLYKLIHSVFEKSLEGYKQNDYTGINGAVVDAAKEQLDNEDKKQENIDDNQSQNKRPPLGGGQ